MNNPADLPTYRKLRAMSGEELIAAFDAREGYRIGPEFMRQEIALREQERLTNTMLEATLTMKRLSWLMALLATVAAVSAVVSVVE